MTTNTPNRAYTYPEPTDNVELWTHFETLALQLDDDVQDNIMSAWTNYTPAFTTLGGGSPTIGSGATIHGRSRKIGKTVHTEGLCIFGTSPNFGTGAFQFSLPYTAATVTNATWLGQCYARDSSAGAAGHFTGFCSIGSAATVAVMFASSGNAQVAAAVPFTWVATDFIRWSATYEAA